MAKRLLLIVGIVAALTGAVGFVVSCAGGPAPQGGGGKQPGWVTSMPEDTADSAYFIGVGTSASGDTAEAENAAVLSMLAEITRFLGVRITAETTVEARDTLEQYEMEMTEKIKQESAARVGDFRVKEKYIDRGGDSVTVYMLGEYDKEALLKEQARLRAVFAEQQEAISGPEKEGDILVEGNEWYAAAVKYIEAASAAVTSDVDNAAIKLERNINKAKRAIDNINLMPRTGEQTTAVGEPFPKPFTCTVTAGASAGGAGVPGANVTVVYKEMRRNGRMGIESLVLQSDNQGVVAFERPSPKFVGSDQITMYLNFGSYMETLEDAPERFQPYVEGLEELVMGKRVTFQYSVYSMAKEVSTGIAIVDVDRAGNPRNVSDCQAGILESLSEAGFRVRALRVDFPLQDLSDQEIIQRIAAAYGGQIERVIFGVGSISEFSESEGSYIVKVNGTVKAAELAGGEILYTGSSFKRSRGSNTQSALSAAFKGLGRELGTEMAAKLP
jgi:formiminotetrahydrofolate cyclodeaminase